MHILKFRPLQQPPLIRPLVAGTPLTDPWVHVGVLLAYALVGYVAATVFIRRRMMR
jgi:lipooligosaccharide transport system permease protein